MEHSHGVASWIISGLVVGSVLVCTAETEPVFPDAERGHLARALQHLNVGEEDLGFHKDVASPGVALRRVRHMLEAPLELVPMADECLAAVDADRPSACWDISVNWLELSPLPPTPSVPAHPAADPSPAQPPTWQEAVDRFRLEAHRAHDLLQTAYARVDRENRHYLAAALLGETFAVDDDQEVRRAVQDIGIPSAVLARVIQEGDDMDPEPVASNYLAIVSSIDIGAMAGAVQLLQSAVDTLRKEAAGVSQWPASPTNIPTPLGTIRIGTPGNDHYADPSPLILEPGGDDTYTGRAGSANGLTQAALAVIIDLSGDDSYTSADVLGPGSALFGIALLVDSGGNDTYRVAYTGLAAGLFGAASLTDEAGDDFYQALALAQGAGYAGIGILRDRKGDDRYDLGYSGQAYAGVRGVGMLIDDLGNDRYTAGGKHPDHDRHQGRYLSTAQGFAIGMRPFAGGGVAALVDRSGNDSYVADVYGQGVSYWYSVGMLLDEGGDDSYQVYEYGQGSGIHLSLGLLSDRSGNDVYTGFSLSQGCAHDYAVGVLLDHAGNDTYTADHFSQGLAINNSLGILLDAGGNDGYFALDNTRSQGIGNNGGERDYGGLALLLDLTGTDRYSCGARDGVRVVRPDHGMIYDVCD